jgi:phosphatidylglycerol:prolipoprotein diacylglycerol transferase
MSTFWHWWQHLPEKMDPVIFQIGSFRLQYYGMMYIVAFAITYLLVLYRMRTEPRFKDISDEQMQGLFTAMIIGLILGARLGYVVFYNLPYYIEHPLEIFLPFSINNGWQFTGITGMSFHGGFIGCFIGHLMFVRNNKMNFWDTTDIMMPCQPLGYTFGRLGNFINGELYGRTTDAVYGMYFPNAADTSLRHPSQLYEAASEGILFFLIMWFILRKRVKTRGAMLGIYMIGYGLIRFFIEFVRQPDAHLGFVFFSFSMGQVLCAIMILIGTGLYIYRRIINQPILEPSVQLPSPGNKEKKKKKKKR